MALSLQRLYARLGSRYPAAVLGALVQFQLLVFAVGVAVLALFVDMSASEFWLVLAAALLGQAIWNLAAQRLIARHLQPLTAWIDGRRDERAGAEAWEAGASLPLEFLRFQRRSPLPYLLMPAWCAFTVWQVDLAAWAFPVLYAISLVAVIYGISLQFLATERVLRPVLEDIGLGGAEVGAHPGPARLPLRRRLLVMLPAINITSGVVVAGLSDGGDSGLDGFALAVAAAVGVALSVSLVLGALLADSVVAPIRRLRDATDRVRRGDLGVRVAAVSSDETGELAASFNRPNFPRFPAPVATDPVLARSTTLSLLLALTLAAGCGGDDDKSVESPDREPKVHDPGPIHVHGLGVNPADGALFVATHTGLFRAPVGEERATRVAGRYQDTMGFTVVGPDRFLGSGHPDQREGLPPFLGLIRSVDAGETWDPVSLLGKRDFHVLEASGKRVYGYGSDYESREAGLLVSDDGGGRWQKRRAPEPLIAAAIDPSDPDRLVASGERRPYLSADAARSWRELDAPPGLLAWTAKGSLYLVDGEGSVSESRDGARFERVGSIGGEPAAFEAHGDELYAALHDGLVKRSTDAGRSWEVRSRP